MTLEQALINYAEHNDEHEASSINGDAPCHCDYCQVWIPMAHKVETDNQALRLQLAACHEAIGSALALLRQEQTSAAMLVLDDALKGTRNA